MSEYDELVSRPGVVMAGRLGPDGRVAEHQSTFLYEDNPAAMELAHWFAAAVTMLLNSMAGALDGVTVAGSWLPMGGWTYSGGDYGIALYGTSFVFFESAKIGSLDEMAGLLRRTDS